MLLFLPKYVNKIQIFHKLHKIKQDHHFWKLHREILEDNDQLLLFMLDFWAFLVDIGNKNRNTRTHERFRTTISIFDCITSMMVLFINTYFIFYTLSYYLVLYYLLSHSQHSYKIMIYMPVNTNYLRKNVFIDKIIFIYLFMYLISELVKICKINVFYFTPDVSKYAYF